ALLVFSGIRMIPNNMVGIVEKRWSAKGSLPTGFIAMNGEAGFQPEVLRGGVHFLMPFQYSVHRMPLVTIPQGKMGYVFARDGFRPVVLSGTDDSIGIVTVHDGPGLPQGEIIAPTVGTDPTETRTYHNNFQDPDLFLLAGGYRGRQLQVLVEGTHYLNRL